ncbi:MAG: 3'(2'),5'-bisphosphate nucleotidase CysQ [Firmicutes bacterium]|nr:3'(2'),5'-bisphosphate nucleotidase CysQ [Bacillota bacterium]
MESQELLQWFERLMPVVLKARTAILTVLQSGQYDTHAKMDQSPVTRADEASHRILVKGLSDLWPDIAVVSEESSSTDAREDIQRFWLVDPLDGTKEFLRGSAEFTINVALVEHGVPVFGVVDVPKADTTYAGGGGAAWVRDARGVQRLVPRLDAADGGWVVALSRSHRDLATSAWLDAHGIFAREVRYAGSAVKFCWIAQGEADVYLRLKPTMGWDTAAGQALVEAMGGVVLDLEGRPLRYQPSPQVNPPFVAISPGAWAAGISPAHRAGVRPDR